MTDIDRMSATIEELQQTVEHYKGCADEWYRVACDYAAKLRLHNIMAAAKRKPATLVSVEDKLPEHEIDKIDSLTAEVEALREDYAALLKLHNTTAQAARSEECAMRLE